MTSTYQFQTGAIAALGLAFSVFGSTAAQAATLTFDELISPVAGMYGYSFADVPTGYAGFTWSNFGYDSTPPTLSGYSNGVVSDSTILFNHDGNPAALQRTQAFDFNSVYLTAAWNNDLNVLVEGFVGATQKYERTVTVNTVSPALFNFDFLGVDRVRFSAFGGTPSGYLGIGTHFVLDNLTVDRAQASQNPPVAAQAVPEPMTIAGLALAGAGLTAARRKRQAVKS